jgi:hypothetical protein
MTNEIKLKPEEVIDYIKNFVQRVGEIFVFYLSKSCFFREEKAFYFHSYTEKQLKTVQRIKNYLAEEKFLKGVKICVPTMVGDTYEFKGFGMLLVFK